MNWLFYVLAAFVIICMIQGARKGFLRTAVAMVFMILVLFVASWINPFIGKFLRESTPVYQVINQQCEKIIAGRMDDVGQANGSDAQISNKRADLPTNLQVQFIENVPLPQSIKHSLLENNNSEIYQALGADTFSDYLARYLAYSITNGIGFLLSFMLATVIIKVILYAVDMLTALPGLNIINAIGGLALGAVQGILWIWIFFLIITVLYNTSFGQVLMRAIDNNPILTYLYDKNILLDVIMSVITGN